MPYRSARLNNRILCSLRQAQSAQAQLSPCGHCRCCPATVFRSSVSSVLRQSLVSVIMFRSRSKLLLNRARVYTYNHRRGERSGTRDRVSGHMPTLLYASQPSCTICRYCSVRDSRCSPTPTRAAGFQDAAPCCGKSWNTRIYFYNDLLF